MRDCLLIGALSVVLLACVACDKSSVPHPRDPVPEITLPDSPTMEEPSFVAQYTDGSLTVAGLLSARSKHLGTAVKIKGAVQKVHRCTDNTVECKPPEYAVLVDSLEKPYKRLVVTGGADTDFAKLKEKEVVLINGRYVQSDPAGRFVRMEGLVIMQVTEDSRSGIGE